MESEYDIIIIGGASAGLTAGIYSARQGMRTLIITKDIGGQALLTTEIQNYPGFNSIGGFELMNKFQEQAILYGSEFLYDEVKSVNKILGGFEVKTMDRSLMASAVILAFGKTPRDLNVIGESEYAGKGVSYCAICDGPLYRGKDLAVIGHGDHALQAVIYLAGLSKKLYLVTKSNKLVGDPDMIRSIEQFSNVETITSSFPVELKGNEVLTSVKLRNEITGRETEISVDGVFVEMGYIAKTDFVKNMVSLNSSKEVIINSNGETSQEGIFACGDVTNVPYKQAVISAGQGAVAALSAYNYVQRIRGKIASKNDWKFLKPVNPQ
ncbi:MAG: FAD-dependent oxidoreductase [Thermoplasmataceae archaeon]|jgi:thioredoxin reductase (NADPH)